MAGSGEWVPLYISIFLMITTFAIIPNVVNAFVDTNLNPNFYEFNESYCVYGPQLLNATCTYAPTTTYGTPTDIIVNFIANGFNLNLGLFEININIFSAFGLAPNNFLQEYLITTTLTYSYLPPSFAMPILVLTFLGIIYTTVRLARG